MNDRRRVRIETQCVGQAFACCGIVRDLYSGRVLYQTREYPYEYYAPALNDAECWAKDNGYQIDKEQQ